MDITKRMSSWFMKPGVKASTLAVCHCPEGGVGDTHTHTHTPHRSLAKSG